jgi:hypothetical protein
VSDVGEIYQRHIVDDGKQAQMLVLASFLVTFTIVRLITHAIRAGKLRRVFRNVETSGGLHVHHLVIGIFLLIGTGYVSVGMQPTVLGGLLAVLFGIGAALTLDEFALWLCLKDVYWTREGRASVDAVVIMASMFTLGLIGIRFWLELGRLIIG